MSGTVIVTGAGGFVGSAVVRGIVRAIDSGIARFQDGSNVDRVVALLRPGSPEKRLRELSKSTSWSIERMDLRDQDGISALIDDHAPRAMMHLASDRILHGPWSERSVDEHCLQPLATLVAALARIEGSRFIHTSSVWVLPEGTELAEDTRPAPRGSYARAKAAADDLLPDLCARSRLEWMTLRLFNVFGRYEDFRRLIPMLTSRLSLGLPVLLSTGDQVRDFIDVDDVAGAYLAALRAPSSAAGALYHIGSGHGTTVREAALRVARRTGNTHLIRFGAVDRPDMAFARQVSDPRRAERALGWRASPDVGNRIDAVVAWWRRRWGFEPDAATEAREATRTGSG